MTESTFIEKELTIKIKVLEDKIREFSPNISPLMFEALSIWAVHKSIYLQPEVIQKQFSIALNLKNNDCLMDSVVEKCMKKHCTLGLILYEKEDHNKENKSVDESNNIIDYIHKNNKGTKCFEIYEQIIETCAYLQDEENKKDKFIEAFQTEPEKLNDSPDAEYPAFAVNILFKSLLEKRNYGVREYLLNCYYKHFLARSENRMRMINKPELRKCDNNDENDLEIKCNTIIDQENDEDSTSDSYTPEFEEDQPNDEMQNENMIETNGNLEKIQIGRNEWNKEEYEMFEEEIVVLNNFLIANFIEEIENNNFEENDEYKINVIITMLRKSNKRYKPPKLSNKILMALDPMEKYKPSSETSSEFIYLMKLPFEFQATIEYMLNFAKYNTKKYELSIEKYGVINIDRLLESCKRGMGHKILFYGISIAYLMQEKLANNKNSNEVYTILTVLQRLLTSSHVQLYKHLPHLYTQLSYISIHDITTFNKIDSNEKLKNFIYLIIYAESCDISLNINDDMNLNTLESEELIEFIDLCKEKCFNIKCNINMIIVRNVNTNEIVKHTITRSESIDNVNKVLEEFSDDNCYDFIITGKFYNAINKINIQYLNYESTILRYIELCKPEELITVSLEKIIIENLNECVNLTNLYSIENVYSYNDICNFTKLTRFCSLNDKYIIEPNTLCMVEQLFLNNKMFYIYVCNDTDVITSMTLSVNIENLNVFYHECNKFTSININLDHEYPKNLMYFVNRPSNEELLKEHPVTDFVTISGPKEDVERLKSHIFKYCWEK